MVILYAVLTLGGVAGTIYSAVQEHPFDGSLAFPLAALFGLGGIIATIRKRLTRDH